MMDTRVSKWVSELSLTVQSVPHWKQIRSVFFYLYIGMEPFGAFILLPGFVEHGWKPLVYAVSEEVSTANHMSDSDKTKQHRIRNDMKQ